MQPYSYEIWQAVRLLIGAGIIALTFKLSRDGATKAGRGRALRVGSLWCLGVAIFATMALGQPSCEEQGDPLHGTCEQTAENGFLPTDADRAATFLYWAIILGTPMLIGAFSAPRREPRPQQPTDQAPPLA